MGERQVVPGDRSISPLQTAYNLTPLIATQGRAPSSLGIVPIGYYKGGVAFFDLDKMANQPLIWAEKQWTIDKVDERDGPAGTFASVTVPINSPDGAVVRGTLAAGGVITVPAGQVWYLQSHRYTILQSALLAVCTGIRCSFAVSSWPKVAVTGVDKTYHTRYFPEDITANINAGDINLGPYDFRFLPGELGTELRLVGGDTLTALAWAYGGICGVAPVTVLFTVYGYKAKLLVV